MRHDRERAQRRRRHRELPPSFLCFFSLTRSHKRKHFPCMWCQWHRVHYLACHHHHPPQTPPSPTLKACQMLLGCHSEQPHDPDIHGFDLFSSKWQWSATAMFAWRCSVFLQYLLDLRLKLDLASTDRQIEHLPRTATRVDQIYLFIYSFMFGLPSIGNPWSILMNSGKIKEKNKMILNMFFKA